MSYIALNTDFALQGALGKFKQLKSWPKLSHTGAANLSGQFSDGRFESRRVGLSR